MAGNLRMGSLKKFQESLNKLKDGSSVDKFIESCTKELAQRLLRKVILRTPVGDYSETYDLVDDGEQKFLVMSDKEGGTLRRGWTSIASLEVTKSGSMYKVIITNSTPYASYVEFGHRQTPGRYVPAINRRLKKGWVQGQFMMTISEKEIQESASKILEQRVKEFLGSVFGEST